MHSDLPCCGCLAGGTYPAGPSTRRQPIRGGDVTLESSLRGRMCTTGATCQLFHRSRGRRNNRFRINFRTAIRTAITTIAILNTKRIGLVEKTLTQFILDYGIPFPSAATNGEPPPVQFFAPLSGLLYTFVGSSFVGNCLF